MWAGSIRLKQTHTPDPGNVEATPSGLLVTKYLLYDRDECIAISPTSSFSTCMVYRERQKPTNTLIIDSWGSVTYTHHHKDVITHDTSFVTPVSVNGWTGAPYS